MLQQKAQFVPQLAQMGSCGWQRGDSGSMWGHLSTNYNSPHGRVVAQVVPFVVAPDFFNLIWTISVQCIILYTQLNKDSLSSTTTKKKKKKSHSNYNHLIAGFNLNFGGSHYQLHGFSLFSILFYLDVSFCFKYTIASDSKL